MSFNSNDFIKDLLNLTDEYLLFSGNISTEIVSKSKTKVFDAVLTYDAKVCPCCGNIEKGTIIKHGNKYSIARILPVNGMPAAIRIKKQRFLCKECEHTFIAETNLVKKYNSISKPLKFKILETISQKISEKDIAKLNNISHSTISKYIDSGFSSYIPKRDYLPKNLSFDEFKSTKDATGSMSFIMTDLDKRKIIDIVENRQLRDLKKYFYSFDKKARLSVESVTIDMYSPYITLIKEVLPNANIIFDRFHIINNLARALIKTRIEEMKTFSTQSYEYKRLKKY